MYQTLKDFVTNWNLKHKRFSYALFYGPGVNRPASVEVRYSAVKYRNFLYEDGTWETMRVLVEAKSHGTMFVITDEWLLQRGVLEIKVASHNHNFKDEYIIDTLRWLGEEFFGSLDYILLTRLRDWSFFMHTKEFGDCWWDFICGGGIWGGQDRS
jgi:hypothetical protein